jgi:hypothetical protein
MNDKSEKITIDKIPRTYAAIKDFLVSIKSIGIKTANRIVYNCKLRTLIIIQDDISLLGKVNGLGPKKRRQLEKHFVKVQEIMRMIF